MRAAVLLLLASLAPVAADDAGWTSFEFDSYNREYVNVRPGAAWETEGPFKVHLSSPAHRLVVFDHSIDLRQRDAEVYETRIRVHFAGDGDVLARIGIGSAAQTLEDHVHAPDQEVEVRALVAFREVEGGYEMETIELPETVTVAIESELGGRMVSICQTAFAFMGVQCSAVDAMFSHATVPLPAAGGTYYLPTDRLSRAENLRFSRFLADGYE